MNKHNKFAWLFTALVIVFAQVIIPFNIKPAFAGTDDYPSPWRAPTSKDFMTDTWGYFNRECVSFVAWRLNSRNGMKTSDISGLHSAADWKDNAIARGFVVNNTPAAGAVAWWDFGHVAWVESVGSTTVHVEEYNYDYAGNYHQRDVAISGVTKFIHFKDMVSLPRIGHLGSNNTLWIKQGAVNAGWDQIATNVSSFKLSSKRIAILQGGSLSVKEGELGSDWKLVATNVVSFAITDNRIGVLDAAGNLSVKQGGVTADWNWIATNVSSFELSPNRVGALFGASLQVKEGSVLGGWTPLASNVGTYRLTDNRIGALFGNVLNIKEGGLGAGWTPVMSPTNNFFLSPNRIMVNQTNNNLYVKEGPLGAQWTWVSGPVNGFAISDSRVMRWLNGTLNVRDGTVTASWTDVATSTIGGALSK